MSHDEVAAAYDALAERWLDGRFVPDNGVSAHRRALALLSGPSGFALNVGCGCNTRFTRLFREHGLAVEGIDISRRMVALARAADPDTPVHHADICDWVPPRHYSLISAWDCLWHVSLHRHRPVLQKLLDALAPGGVFVFTAGGLAQPAEHVDSRMGPPLYYASPGIPALLEVIHATGSLCRHLEFDQWPENHVVIIAQRAR